MSGGWSLCTTCFAPITPQDKHVCAPEAPMTHVTPALARVNDPETSKQAAEEVNTGALELAVLSAIRAFPDSSIGDVVEYLALDSNCISPRFAPLRRKGLIVCSGKKVSRQTGKKVQTWRVA